MGRIQIDVLAQAVHYRCDCGRRITVKVSEMQVGSTDYCGCGRVKIGFDIANYRQLLGSPEPNE